MGLQPDDSRSPARQIVDELRRQIALGELKPGSQVPSNTEIRAHYNVSNQTAQNAISALKNDGLVYSVPGRGVFVRTDLDRDELLTRIAGSQASPEIYSDLLTRVSELDKAQDVLSEEVAELRKRLEVVEQRQDADTGGRGASSLSADH